MSEQSSAFTPHSSLITHHCANHVLSTCSLQHFEHDVCLTPQIFQLIILTHLF